jgi:hypothetical protein
MAAVEAIETLAQIFFGSLVWVAEAAAAIVAAVSICPILAVLVEVALLVVALVAIGNYCLISLNILSFSCCLSLHLHKFFICLQQIYFKAPIIY